MRVLGLVPYFSGTSSATNSAMDTRRQYLEATVESLWGFCDDVIVGTCQEEFDVHDLGLSEHRIEDDIAPEWLPTALLREIKHEEGVDDYDLFYVTEADQVLHIDHSILPFIRNIRYLVPHRMEKAYKGVVAEWSREVEIDGELWYSANGTSPKGRPGFEGDFYKVPPHRNSMGLNPHKFGGAFLAGKQLFMGTPFEFAYVFPVEHATGLDIAESGQTWKTMEYGRFWVEHLSGIEFHEKLYNAKRKEDDAPSGSGLEDPEDTETDAEGVDVPVPEAAAALPGEVS